MATERDLPSVPAALEGATVLVTGGAGFVGSHLADALAPVADVRVLDDCSTGRPENVPADATLRRADVTDDDALAAATTGADYVFHLAAMSSVPDSLKAPTRCLDVNATGTAAVLDRARQADARVVFASSAAVYGSPESTPIPEDAPLRPLNPYGISKRAADEYVRQCSDWFDADGVALRFFNVYGPRQQSGRGVVPTFVDRARAGDRLVVHGDGSQTRDFVHVDDVVRAMLRAASADVIGEAYNVGTGETTSIRTLAETVRDAAGESVDVAHDDPRPADIRHSRADVSKIRADLGFEPAITLADGIESLL